MHKGKFQLTIAHMRCSLSGFFLLLALVGGLPVPCPRACVLACYFPCVMSSFTKPLLNPPRAREADDIHKSSFTREAHVRVSALHTNTSHGGDAHLSTPMQLSCHWLVAKCREEKRRECELTNCTRAAQLALGRFLLFLPFPLLYLPVPFLRMISSVTQTQPTSPACPVCR